MYGSSETERLLGNIRKEEGGFLPSSGFLSRRDISYGVESDVKPQTCLPSSVSCTMDQEWKRKYLNIFFHHRILGVENIIQIWTDPEGNIMLYGPRESNIAQGRRSRAILLSRGSYNLICSRDQSIFVLLYDHWQMEEALITHQTEETFWLNYHYQVSLLIQ